MKVPHSYYDEIFQFQGQWEQPSCCGLKIRKTNGKTYIIVTELYQENPGSSVTYAGKSLFEQICKQKGFDNATDIVYIECNPNTNSKLSFYDEEYFVVDFNADMQHKYKQMSQQEIKKVLDEN